MLVAEGQLIPYLDNLTLSLPREEAGLQFKILMDDYMAKHEDCWGTASFGHYPHHLCAHMASRIARYGAPQIWSTQSHEKSHWNAHRDYFKYTNQGGTLGAGGITPTDPLKQLLQHSMRLVFHRLYKREVKELNDLTLEKFRLEGKPRTWSKFYGMRKARRTRIFKQTPDNTDNNQEDEMETPTPDSHLDVTEEQVVEGFLSLTFDLNAAAQFCLDCEEGCCQEHQRDDAEEDEEDED